MPITFYDSDENQVSSINEGSSVDVNVVCKDEEGTSLTPNSLKWWWSDIDGDAINSKEEIAAIPANPTIIKLTPDETTLTKNKDEARVFTVKAIYNSSLGNGRTATEWATLTIKNSKVIS